MPQMILVKLVVETAQKFGASLSNAPIFEQKVKYLKGPKVLLAS